MGLAPTQTLDKKYETPAFEEVVYDILRQQAQTALSVGSCVILDALFYNEAERKAVEALAKEKGVPFVGLWMDAPLHVREERVKTRLRNPSDVREKAQLETQLTIETGPITWHKIMTDGAREKTLQKALSFIRQAIRHRKRKK